MNTKTLIPQPLLPILGEGEPERSPSPYLGEGFRVRAKTTVLNIDEVYKLFHLFQPQSAVRTHICASLPYGLIT